MPCTALRSATYKVLHIELNLDLNMELKNVKYNLALALVRCRPRESVREAAFASTRRGWEEGGGVMQRQRAKPTVARLPVVMVYDRQSKCGPVIQAMVESAHLLAHAEWHYLSNGARTPILRTKCGLRGDVRAAGACDGLSL